MLSIQNYFTFSKCIQLQSFIITHKKISQDRTHLFDRKMYLEKGNMYLMLQIQKVFFNSALVMFKSGLCSNDKLTAISIASLSGILLNKLQTS